MSNTHQLLQLFKNLDSEVNQLEYITKKEPEKDEDITYNNDVFIASLELEKLNVTMDKARSILLELEASTSSPNNSPSASTNSLLMRSSSPKINNTQTGPLRTHLKTLNSRIQHIGQTIRAIQLQETNLYNDEQRRKQQQEQQGKEKDVSSFKHRNISHNNDSSLDQKLSVQKNTQETLSTEILDMVSTMKSNALKFADKITEDNNVVSSTSEALHKSSGNMNKVGNKLSTWQKSSALGYRFYIFAGLFLFLSLVIGMTLVQLFPKW